MLDLEEIGQGATTKIYRDEGTAIKLYLNAPPGEAENEAARQRFAHDAGLPVPAVYGVRELGDGAVALDMEYIDGKPLMRLGMDKDERNATMHALVKLQCDVHKVNAAGLAMLHDRLEWRIKGQEILNETQKSKMLSLLEGLKNDSCNLCHGDFHPLNILYDGVKYWIIDWVDATAGDPLADACRTYLIFKQYLNRSAGIYLRCFCKAASAAPSDVLAWLPIVAAARLSENQDGKAKSLLLDIVREWCETR